MKFRVHLHIPSLFSMSCAAAAPVVDSGDADAISKLRKIYDAFCAVLEANACVNTNNWLSIYKHAVASHGEAPALPFHSIGDTSMLVSLIDHYNISPVIDDDGSYLSVKYLLHYLCQRTDDVVTITNCIHRLAYRYLSSLGSEIMQDVYSDALLSIPIVPIRNCLISYGAACRYNSDIMTEWDWLYYAAGNGQIDVIQSAIDNGVDINGYSHYRGRQLLTAAMASDDDDLMTMLISHGAKYDASLGLYDDAGDALHRNNSRMFEKLIQNNLLTFWNVPRPPRHSVWHYIHTIQCAKCLIDAGYTVDEQGIIELIENNDLSVLKWCGDDGDGGHTVIPPNVLSRCTQYPRIQMLDYLIANGAVLEHSITVKFPKYATYWIEMMSCGSK